MSEIISLNIPSPDMQEGPDKNVPQETIPQKEEILSEDYLNSTIRKVRGTFGLILASETLKEAEEKIRKAFNSYIKKISPDSEDRQKIGNSPKLIAQLKSFATICFNQDVAEIVEDLKSKEAIQKEEGKSFLGSFERTDSGKIRAIKESPEYLFGLLAAKVGYFESEVKKNFGNYNEETKKKLLQTIADVKKKKLAIEDKYRNSLSDLKTVLKEDRSELTDTGITNVEYTARVVLIREMGELEKFMKDTLQELGIN